MQQLDDVTRVSMPLRGGLLFALILPVLGCDPEIHLGSLGAPVGGEGGSLDASVDADGDFAADSTSGGERDREADARLGDERPANSREGGALDTGLSETAARADAAGTADGRGDASAPPLWSSSFEVGDLSEWTSDGKGGINQTSALEPPTVIATPAREMRAAEFRIAPPDAGVVSASYLYRQQQVPVEAYYSAWFNVPQEYVVRNYWNILHFTASPTGNDQGLIDLWDVDLQTRTSDNQLIAYVYQFPAPPSTSGTRFDDPAGAPPVPTNTWVHFEALLRNAADATGHFTLWQDGVVIVDIAAPSIAATPYLRWSVGSAAIDISPSPAVLYVDDVAISTTRIPEP